MHLRLFLPLRWSCAGLVLLFSVALNIAPAGPQASVKQVGKLDLQKGDRIAIIGNELAERLQHEAWLEAFIYERLPAHELVIRNLGFAGDELTVKTRSANFGTTDAWLAKTQASVVFAFFGYNESFAGEKGLAKFGKDLDGFINHTLATQYDGKKTARLVLFSPTANENLKNRLLPDGSANNQRLEKYTAVMAETAKSNGVPFVDLYHPTFAAFAKGEGGPFTINGVHFNERGNQLVASIIDKTLFGERTAKLDEAKLEKIREAVVDKNFYWFNRYRVLDGYNVYGDRSLVKYVDGLTNRTVMDREMEVLDVMTANRDKRVWAVAQGGDLQVDDSNTPPFIDVKTNKAGKLPGGQHLYLSGEDAISKMTLGKNLKINLFASEQEFPELKNPVQMAFDPQGRLWVAVWPNYPHWKPKDPRRDKILVFEDTKGTGKADKCTVFADNLECPTGFDFYDGGIFLAQAPYLMFLKDTKGTGKADLQVKLLSTLDSADSHHSANSFTFDPGGALYFQEGTFHHSSVETPYGPTIRTGGREGAGVFRYEPRTQKFEVYMDVAFANPHGHVFDRWGQDIVIDATGAIPYHATLYTGQTAAPDQRHPKQVLMIYKNKTRPCPGIEILSSRHFPESMQGNLLVPNVIGFQGILQYKLSDQGASFVGSETDYLVKSSDPNFRPGDLKIGGDGALYFLDWQNPIIGHLQHHLRDPSRGHDHGRIYRITYEGRPLLTPAKIAGEPIDKLLDVLKEPEDRVRYRARIELAARDSNEVLFAVSKWIAKLDPKDANYEHNLMEALWLHQSHHVVNDELLRRMLHSPDFHARAAATHVLCYWRDEVSQPLDLLRVQIHDSHPRVRLEAIRALSFFHSDEALGIALELLTHPTDPYLNFTFNETLSTLERRLKIGTKVDSKNLAGSLVSLLQKGKLDNERKAALIEAICIHGGPKELKAIWDEALVAKSFNTALRSKALVCLADAALTARVQPGVNADDMLKFIHTVEPALLADALHLAGAWKMKQVSGTLEKIANDEKAVPDARFAAMDALASLGDPGSVKTLRELTVKPHPLAVQFHAAMALTQADLDGAAAAAAASLATTELDVDPAGLIQAFLVRKEGSDKLAAALQKHKIAPDTAKRIYRAMLLAGRSDAALANLISRFAGMEAATNMPTPAEVQKIGAEVMAKGDAARGELVFRRLDLGCMKCHAINKTGGNIGPDLGPIGGSSPIDYVVASVLDPNASIKEEYLTKVITTVNGNIVTGIVAERSNKVVVLKDATGKIVRIPTADIDQEANGKSLMPEDVTRGLTKGELLDLIRFVSELGKPGPYAIPSAVTVQRWKKLAKPNGSLTTGLPDSKVLHDAIQAAGPADWETVYAQVNGKLPLAELHKAGQPDLYYLQGEMQVHQSGPVEFRVDSSAPAALWIDDVLHEQSGKTVVSLTPGRHRIVVRLDARTAKDGTLRVELVKPADSAARFEVLNGVE
jgi:putative heme-binding domain-containing protein